MTNMQDKKILTFFGCYFTLVLSTYASYPSIRLAELTEQCYVIGNFTEEPMTKRVADTAWAYSCSENKYITAVWSEDVGGRFVKAKCCGNITDNSFSWEIRDLSFFHKGSDRIDEKWNIECEKYAIITGFRFAANERLIFLSSVRCSLLIDKIVDKNNCKLLEFDEKPDQHTNYNDKWQYECPFGYGLVGLYDDQSFMSIKKAKCCKITDEKINPGWKSNFSNNLAGYTQDQDDDNDFELDESYLITTFLKASSKAQFYRIVSPGFSIAPFCFVISQVVSGNAVINIYLRNNSTDLLLRKIKTYVPSKPESYQILVKPTSRSQLVIEVEISKGLYTIEELSVEEENFCKSKCSIDPMIGCSVNEECLQEGSNSQCVCKKNFTRDEKGNCVIGLHSTNGPSITSGQGKGPDGGDFTLRKSTVQKSSTMITTTSKNVMPEVSKNHIEKNSNLTLVILAAVLSAVILIVILLAFYLCYKNNIPSKLKRMTSFELELHEIEKRGDVGYINNNFLSHQASMDSITSISNSIYRTYMNNIGSVEEVSSSPTIEVTKESQLVSIMVNHTDEEPIYTRINHKSQNMKTSNFLNQQLSPDDAHGYTNLNSDSKNIEKFIRNQYNCSVTYSEPEYGDSLIEDSAAKIEFSIPGSDEEELLSSLHEIDEESIDMSAKVLGQGAFGLVKLALLNSVKGKKEVAVKILKRGNSSNILQDDRVLFWQEAAIMSQFDHPNVIAFYGVMVGKVPSMVVEYLPRGNLWKFLKTAQRLRMANGVHVINHDLHKLFLRMARDIVAGIAYLATLKFVHRDLAARNILLDSDLRCKIADFGLSRHFLKEEHYYLSNGGQIPVKWTAPEALQFKKYSSKSDVWSYGIVLWEIWSIGIRPYENWSNDKVIKEVCENNYRLPAPSGVPSYIYKLMLDCWHTDKNQRPSFSQIKFSLKQDDARIIGKYPVQLERKRSLTFPATEEESHSFDVSF